MRNGYRIIINARTHILPATKAMLIVHLAQIHQQGRTPLLCVPANSRSERATYS
jgi:hypothetical protein